MFHVKHLFCFALALVPSLAPSARADLPAENIISELKARKQYLEKEEMRYL